MVLWRQLWTQHVFLLAAFQLALGQSSTIDFFSPETTSVQLLEPSMTVGPPIMPTAVQSLSIGGVVPTPSIPSSDMTPSPLPSSITITAANLSQLFVGSGSCSCDVLVGKCDVYCCCDQECTRVEQIGFMCADTGSSDDVCLDRDDIFRSSLPSCSCSDPGLFCVQTDNNPSRLEYDDPVFVESGSQFSSQLELHSSPGYQPLLQLKQQEYGMAYQVGDPVMVVKDGSTLGYLSLPSPLNGLQCHDSNPIAYLLDEAIACERPLASLAMTCTSDLALNALSVFQNFHILQVPSDFVTFNPTSAASVPLLVECRNLAGQPVLCDLPTYDAVSGMCNHILLEARYVLFHNGTGEIVEASVDITLGSVSDDDPSVIQRFAVSYIVAGEADVALKRSGKPGYLDGEPVLAGSITDGGQINITVDNTMWLVVMGSSGECGSHRGISVGFREDLITACNLNISLQSLLDDCQGVRDTALALLVPNPSHTHVGKYGNSDPLESSQWVPLIEADTTQSENLGSAGRVCQDVVTSLQVSILYSYTGSFDDPEAVITGAEYRYTTEDIVALCRGQHCYSENPMVPVSLQTAVTFTDVSDGPSKLLKSTSDIVRKLPQDFLYPFFVSQAQTIVLPHSCVLVFVMLTCVFSLCY